MKIYTESPLRKIKFLLNQKFINYLNRTINVLCHICRLINLFMKHFNNTYFILNMNVNFFYTFFNLAFLFSFTILQLSNIHRQNGKAYQRSRIKDQPNPRLIVMVSLLFQYFFFTVFLNIQMHSCAKTANYAQNLCIYDFLRMQ